VQQLSFFENIETNSPENDLINTSRGVQQFNLQLLKWIGNKQRFAYEIIKYFPERFGTYFEPFLGSGGVLATLFPKRAIASDSFSLLIEIFKTLQSDPERLKQWYAERWHRMKAGDKRAVYEEIRSSYNINPNAADLVFISRACYGGVVRFRVDGYISTPVGIHEPISPNSFSRRVDEWHKRTQYTTFYCLDFEEAMSMAKPGDLIYCDPPYSHSQSILYGAQSFDLEHLLSMIEFCKRKNIYVALSIDGSKKSGGLLCNLPIPQGLFEREVFLKIGRSMLKRFQMNGKTLEGEVVRDRLLLTY